MNRYHGVLDARHDGAYYRALRSGETLALLRVAEAGGTLSTEIVATTGPVDETALHHTIRRMLGVDEDYRAFYAVAAADGTLAQVIEPLIGLRHFQSETVFEALLMVIIEQQISLAAALRAQHVLAAWGGNVIEYDGRPHYAFPMPEQIADAPRDAFTPLKITWRRVDLMQHIARMVIDGKLNLEGLRHVCADDAYTTLTSIKGIGHWTAAWTLIRGLGDFGYVGHNDVALRAAVAFYWHGEEGKVSANEVAETFAQYGEHAGLAAFYTLMRWAIDRY